MKPTVNIDFNEVFANTKIHEELSAVIFGAELALRYTNTAEAQLKEIKANIVRSAFDTFTLNYEKMAGAAHTPNAAPRAQYTSADAPAPADTAVYSEPPVSYDSGVSEYDYLSNTPAQPMPERRSGGADTPEQDGVGSYSFQTPDNNDFEDINSSYEQTVVYENYPDPTKRAAFDPESTDGYGNRQENIWGEPGSRQESNQEEDAGFGKIHWTTYSSAASAGDDPSDVSYSQFDSNSEVK